jgi:prolyl-tRNA synthetase
VAAGARRKASRPEAEVLGTMQQRLDEFQAFLLERARERREANSYRGIDSYDRLKEIVDGPGGFVYTGWCGGAECEEKVKDEMKATIRCLPDEEFRSPEAPTKCAVCGGDAVTEAVWAKAY